MNLRYPSLCIENFYNDPDKIREFALKQDYYEATDGRWPGRRTNSLNHIDPDFFTKFCNKVIELFYHNYEKIEYKCETMFQLIEPYSNDEYSDLNVGWIHCDSPKEFAGVIYLTPDANIDSGTSMFYPKDPEKLGLPDLDHTLIKDLFYKRKIENFYSDHLRYHNDHFYEVTRYQNVYNRMICFDGSLNHKANSFYSNGNTRLTQVFFIDILNDVVRPLERVNKWI